MYVFSSFFHSSGVILNFILVDMGLRIHRESMPLFCKYSIGPTSSECIGNIVSLKKATNFVFSDSLLPLVGVADNPKILVCFSGPTKL